MQADWHLDCELATADAAVEAVHHHHAGLQSHCRGPQPVACPAEPKTKLKLDKLGEAIVQTAESSRAEGWSLQELARPLPGSVACNISALKGRDLINWKLTASRQKSVSSASRSSRSIGSDVGTTWLIAQQTRWIKTRSA